MMPKMALTRADMAAFRCQDPNCKDPHGTVLVLRPKCHPSSPTWVAYDLADGTLAVTCAACAKPVTTIEVAAGGPLH